MSNPYVTSIFPARRYFPYAASGDPCQDVINDLKPKTVPATVQTPEGRKAHSARVARFCIPEIGTGGTGNDQTGEFISSLKKWWAAGVGVSPENLEPVQYIHYETGGKYDFHHDEGSSNHRDHYEKTGGQRRYSFILYLNDNFTGGHTEFIHYGKIIPAKGVSMWWKNEGAQTRHRCTPVLKGEKHILATWARERKYTG